MIFGNQPADTLEHPNHWTYCPAFCDGDIKAHPKSKVSDFGDL